LRAATEVENLRGGRLLRSGTSRNRFWICDADTAGEEIQTSTSLIDVEQSFLPVAQMRQVTRITGFEGASIVGEADLGPHHWVWPQHFPDDPIFPGSLIIEAAGQLVALWAWGNEARGRPRMVRASAEFQNPVSRRTPKLVLKGEVRRKRHLYFGVVGIWAEQTEVASVSCVLAVLDPI
jgi:3-hydroxymyristoyl/3-hydroxydecanoyl-(acyl carrier protein) dehydratase